MPRIEYLPQDLAEPAEIVAALRTRRGGTLNQVDRMLLYSPPFAQGWNELAGAVRGQLTLSPKLRELAICGTGLLNGSMFEYEVHRPEFVKAGGTPAQADSLRDFDQASNDGSLFDVTERAVMRFTIEVTKHLRVADATFAAVLKALGSERETIELLGVIAFYNMAARFLIALEI
jgi:alkylhydroperoxidase family enzyme